MRVASRACLHGGASWCAALLPGACCTAGCVRNVTQGHGGGGGGGGMSGAKRSRPEQAAAQPSNNPYGHSSRRPDGKLSLSLQRFHTLTWVEMLPNLPMLAVMSALRF